MTKCNIEKFNRDTVKLYDDSTSPEFLVVINAINSDLSKGFKCWYANTQDFSPTLQKNMEVYNAAIPHK